MECYELGPCVQVSGFFTREVPGCGVAAFAARTFTPGEVVHTESAMLVSAVAAPHGGRNRQLWEALVRLERSRRLPAFEPSGHLGALCALRDFGVAGCRRWLLTKCIGPEEMLPLPQDARREAGVLRAAVGEGLLPQAAAAFSVDEYARLRRVFQLNGFRFNGDTKEGESGYDVGEAIFDQVSRINHSCDPNLSFDLAAQEDGRLQICIKATEELRQGVEVNISYLPLEVRQALPVRERLRQLREHWLFDCKCGRCQAELGEGSRNHCAGCSHSALVPDDCQPGSLPQRSAAFSRSEAAASDSSSQGVCWDDLVDSDR